MFRVFNNSIRLRVKVSPVGALLFSDATRWDVSKGGVVTVRGASPWGPSVYVPATSLRGVMRTFSERLLLGMGLRACDPLLPNACGKGRDAGRDTGAMRTYGESCFVCRTFGSPQLAGRVNVSDLWPWDPEAAPDAQRDAVTEANRTERRGAIATDRRARAGALGHETETEVIARGLFWGEVTLVNVQLWQVALVGLALAEIDQGYVTLGGGAGRGFGRASCRVASAVVRNQLPAPGRETGRHVMGIGADHTRWGAIVPDEAELPEGVEWRSGPLALEANLSSKQWGRFLESLLERPWNALLATKRRSLRNEGHGEGAVEREERGTEADEQESARLLEEDDGAGSTNTEEPARDQKGTSIDGAATT